MGSKSDPVSNSRQLSNSGQTAQSTRPNDIRTDEEAGSRLAPEGAHPSSMAKPTLRRQTLEVGAVCGNPARTDLCGGRSVMGVPTAIMMPHRRAVLRRLEQAR